MNKNFKKVLVVLLSALMIFTYMPAMAFAEGETAPVVVTTKDGSADYTTLDAALAAISSTQTEDATVTLNEDQELTASYAVAYPMIIKLNGKKLTYATDVTLTPAAGAKGTTIADDVICRKDAEDQIVFAKHKANIVYNWSKKANGDYEVVSKNVKCENCGEVTEPVTGTTTKSDPVEGKITYTYKEGEEVKATKVVDAAPAAAYEDAKATIVQVTGVNQHKDGLPVVKATVKDVAINDRVDADAVVTAATEAELKKLHAGDVKQEDGETSATSIVNEPATCQSKGKTIYKVVVSKNGTEVGTVYLKDSQAAEQVAHAKGAFKGYKLLEKAVAENAKTEAEAAKAGKDAGKTVVKVTSEKSGDTTVYYYWFYGNLTPVPSAASSNSQPPVTIQNKNLEVDGSFTVLPVYYCNYEGTTAATEIDDTAFKVAPLPNATSSAQALDGAHSLCEQYAYAPKAITYKFNKNGQTTESTLTCTLMFAKADKAEDAFSHVSDGTFNVIDDPTCQEEGTALVTCAICGEDEVEVSVDKKPDTFGAYPGSASDLDIEDFEDAKGETLDSSAHTITLNTGKTEVTITPTCEEPGGTYKWCTGANNDNEGHWVLQKETPATGHNLVVVIDGEWDEDLDYDAKNNDYIYDAEVVCSNVACDNPSGVYYVTYHSAKRTDTILDKYDAIEINKEEKGKDCKTFAKTTYTVKGVKDRTGAAITTTVTSEDPNTKGDHVYVAKSFNWSADYESATVTCECSTDKTHTGLSQTAKVTKATDATGLTTYTATYGEKSEVKKVYTLDGAKVTYDAAKITDGNLVKGIDGAAAQTPEVTVTLNGTVIDSKELKETWSYDTTTSEVGLTVTWADNKAYDDDAAKKPLPTDKAEAKKIKVAAKSKFNAPTVVVKKGGKETAARTGEYDPATTWSVEATSAVKGATVKYAVDEKDLEQEDIELLAFDLDKVDDIQDAGTYYVYAQQTKDGYTTYSKLATTITITKKSVEVAIDNFTMKEGETPDFKMTVTAGGSVLDVDRDQFDVTSAGGQALEDLIPGDYVLLVSSDNYNVRTLFVEGRVGTVTVLTKEGKTAEEDAKAAAEAADTALAAAKKINTKNYTDDSVKNVAAAKAALQEAIKSGSTADVKAATAALEEAIKNAVAKKANPMKVKAKAKVLKAKAKKATKIAAKKAFKFTKKAQGKVTYKKASGNKKITVAKNGKITVKKGLKKGKTFKIKVKVTAAGNANYKKATKAVTLKIKIK